MKAADFFHRYRDLIPDFPQFLSALEGPLDTALRINTLLGPPEPAIRALARTGVDLRPTALGPVFWTAGSLDHPGHLLEHLVGRIYVQALSSGLPALALAPSPGDLVLDLCAAPGSKTTQMAALMENRGRIVANEPSPGRHAALLTNIRRMSAANVAVTPYPGQSFPLRLRFPRVLVDAPCSGEGNGRMGPERELIGTAPRAGEITQVQKDLLLRGFDVLEEDGVLVYSTCSYNPRENEAVVHHLLRKRKARLLPIGLPIPHDPGVTSWEGESFHEELRHAWRIYPHRLPTVGFFLAKLARG